MASSRLEKIGTIYTRVSGLLRSSAMRWEDRPLWYDIYEAFPPAEEPRYDRPAPSRTLQPIFYREDLLRAQYHKEVKPGISNLLNDEYKSKARRFINTYRKLEGSAAVPKEQLFQAALAASQQEMEDRKTHRENDKNTSMADTFKAAQDQQMKKLDVSKIMQEG